MYIIPNSTFRDDQSVRHISELQTSICQQRLNLTSELRLRDTIDRNCKLLLIAVLRRNLRFFLNCWYFYNQDLHPPPHHLKPKYGPVYITYIHDAYYVDIRFLNIRLLIIPYFSFYQWTMNILSDGRLPLLDTKENLPFRDQVNLPHQASQAVCIGGYALIEQLGRLVRLCRFTCHDRLNRLCGCTCHARLARLCRKKLASNGLQYACFKLVSSYQSLTFFPSFLDRYCTNVFLKLQPKVKYYQLSLQ